MGDADTLLAAGKAGFALNEKPAVVGAPTVALATSEKLAGAGAVVGHSALTPKENAAGAGDEAGG